MMHCKYLGSDQYFYGSVLHLIVTELLPHSPAENLVSVIECMKLIYKDQDTRCRFRTLTLNMFKADLSGFPTLKGRGGELRDFGPVLREVWRHGMQSGVAWQQTVLDTLEASCTIDELLHIHRDEFAFEGSTYESFFTATSTYCQSMQSLYRQGGRQVFNCTIKLHAVWHIGYNSKWENPRLSWCWMGEDFMNVCRTLLFSGSKGVKLDKVHHKALMKLTRAMEWQFKQCE